MATTGMDERQRLVNEVFTLTKMLESHKRRQSNSNQHYSRHFPGKYHNMYYSATDRKKYKVNRLQSTASASHLTTSFSVSRSNFNFKDNRTNLSASTFSTGSNGAFSTSLPRIQPNTTTAIVRKPSIKSKNIVTNGYKSALNVQLDSKYLWTSDKFSNQVPITKKINTRTTNYSNRIDTSINKSNYRKVNSSKSVYKTGRKINRTPPKVKSKTTNASCYGHPWKLKYRFFGHHPVIYPNKVSSSFAVRWKRKTNLNVSYEKFSKRKLINVNGVKYVVNGNRRRLRKREQTTPTKSLDVSGIKSHKLIHHPTEIVKQKKTSRTKYIANRAVNRSIFYLNVAKDKSKQYCLFYNKFGNCKKKESGTCPYIHDSDKIAICKRFLRGECKVDKCPYAHNHCRSKMPTCNFFILGTCHNGEKCNYSHVNVGRDAEICSDFLNGYCASNDKCKKWHYSRCNEFESKGYCNREKCPLLHKARVTETTSTPNPSKYSPSTNAGSKANDEKTTEDESLWFKPLPAFIPISNNDNEKSPEVNTGTDGSLQIRPNFLMAGNR
ncbi:Zinc finger CCCH domain-containing protein 3 [Chamberlinius hualienensis]